jgi:predicted HAD superfamily phosphohydrolase
LHYRYIPELEEFKSITDHAEYEYNEVFGEVYEECDIQLMNTCILIDESVDEELFEMISEAQLNLMYDIPEVFKFCEKSELEVFDKELQTQLSVSVPTSSLNETKILDDDVNLFEEESLLLDIDLDYKIAFDELVLPVLERELSSIQDDLSISIGSNESISFLSKREIDNLQLQFQMKDATYNSDIIVPLSLPLLEEPLALKSVCIFFNNLH